MFRKKGFTLVEILIAVIVVGILIGLSIAGYWRCVEKAKSTEAYVTIGAIRKAEETYKLERGSYVAVSDTKQINKSLGLGITPKYYDFKVVLPDQDNYIVIAERIGKDINAYGAGGRRPREPIVVAMDKSGIMDSGYGVYLGSGGVSGIGGIGESGGIGGIGESGTGGTGVISGTGGTGESGETGETGDSGTRKGGGVPVEYDADIQVALGLLEGSTAGGYYYELIQEKGISIGYDDFSKYGKDKAGAFWVSLYANPDEVAAEGLEFNKIYVNEDLRTQMPASAISAIICHEATHADYDYNPQKWIDDTLERYPELTQDDLHIITSPHNSIDQEFNAHLNQVKTWKEVKGSDTEPSHENLETIYDVGEDFLFFYVAVTYGINEPYNPEEPGLPLY